MTSVSAKGKLKRIPTHERRNDIEKAKAKNKIAAVAASCGVMVSVLEVARRLETRIICKLPLLEVSDAKSTRKLS
jgi:hypothetical protein